MERVHRLSIFKHSFRFGYVVPANNSFLGAWRYAKIYDILARTINRRNVVKWKWNHKCQLNIQCFEHNFVLYVMQRVTIACGRGSRSRFGISARTYLLAYVFVPTWIKLKEDLFGSTLRSSICYVHSLLIYLLHKIHFRMWTSLKIKRQHQNLCLTFNTEFHVYSLLRAFWCSSENTRKHFYLIVTYG